MEIMKKTLLAIIFLIFTKNITAQISEEWINRYDTTERTRSNLIKINNTDLFLLGTISNDIILIKYNLIGQVIWNFRYNGTGKGNDLPSKMIFDKKGNIYINGCSPGVGTGVDYVTIKIDSIGNQIWARRFTSGGNERDASYGLAMDSTGNIFVTGESFSIDRRECLTIKYDSSGNQQWISRFQAGLSCIGYEVICDKWGNSFVTGHGNIGIFTIKYNYRGEQVWRTEYSAVGSETPRSLEIDSSGSIYVAGLSNLGMYWDYITIKYDSSGNELWNRRYNGSGNYMDQLNDMKIDKLGNVYVTGNGTQTGTGYDYTTIKYNTNGTEQWVAKYHNGLNDIATALTIDDFGSVYVTGRSDGNNTQFDYSTVKYDSLGNQMWAIRYNYSNEYDDEARSIVLDNENNIYVTGDSYIWGHSNAVVIKYTQTLTGVYQTQMHLPSTLTLNQNYPNPFNPVTNLGFGISDLGFVSLKVYDVLGNEITTLVNERKSPGNYEVVFDGTGFASGIYFYSLEVDGNTIDTKRMILLK